MLFSSSIFIFLFFPVFFGIYYLSPARFRNAIIIICSITFYAWGARDFVAIVIGTLLVDYILGNVIHDKPKWTRFCVAIDVVMNIGLLLYFKYFNFFLDNINAAMSAMGLHPLVYTSVLLPIGVSFVIFQKMTYCLDIAKGLAKPAESFFYVLEYLLIFPQIIAGPIVKYNELAEQIKHRDLTWDQFRSGFFRFAVGLFKKVWIADIVAKYADTVFNASGTVPIDYAWIGVISYTLQIYFDFSGYSDMAIGMLSMMGFHIGENFNMPYISTSITEFWKRWHISMTSWFREYIYFPLGGNHKGKLRTYLNQWIVFLVSGFWHGAAWSFVFWGAYHGALLCVEKAFLLKAYEKVNRLFRLAITLFLVMVGWVFFRASTIGAGFGILRSMFSPGSYYTHVNPSEILVVDPRGWFVLVVAVLICLLPAFPQGGIGIDRTIRAVATRTYPVLMLCLFILSALKVITGSISPFIYFRF